MVVLSLRRRRSIEAENLFFRRQFALYWERGIKARRVKSRPGRPPIPLDLRQLIRRMATETPIWGEERIANELLLKLGLRVSRWTVRKYLPERSPGRPRGDQRWATFLRNHAGVIVICERVIGTIRREGLDWLTPPSDRRAPRRARQIGAGRFASRMSAGGCVRVIG